MGTSHQSGEVREEFQKYYKSGCQVFYKNQLKLKKTIATSYN